MPTRQETLHTLQQLGDYRQAAKRLGIPPGQLFMIATGLPADGGDTFPPYEADRPGMLGASTQDLVYTESEPENPTAKPHVRRWIAERAAADAQMRQAAQARDAAPGEPLDSEETDVCTVLTRDHDQVTAMLEQMKTIPSATSGGSPVQLSRRASVVDMITVVLSAHESAEQEHFWPAVRSLFPDGEEMAAEALSQEQEGKDILHALGDTPAGEAVFDELVEKLDKAARSHVAYEDRVLLAIGRAMGLDDRRALGHQLLVAKKHAPTRPHPRAPEAPAAAAEAAGAAAAAMDRLRDAAGSRPAERRGEATAEVEDHGGNG